jgi:tRNA-splicing ligase RtcB
MRLGLPEVYRSVGQPVLLGGSMETESYLMVGTETAMKKTLGSTAHGSGRAMSRAAAKRQVRGDELQKKMIREGIYVKSTSLKGLAEEAGAAYKNIHEVVRAVDLAGISTLVARFRPIGNIKG